MLCRQVFYTNKCHAQLGEFERKYLIEELGFPLCDTAVAGPVSIPHFQISVEEKLAAAEEVYDEWWGRTHKLQRMTEEKVGVRISTPGTVCSGVEIGR